MYIPLQIELLHQLNILPLIKHTRRRLDANRSAPTLASTQPHLDRDKASDIHTPGDHEALRRAEQKQPIAWLVAQDVDCALPLLAPTSVLGLGGRDSDPILFTARRTPRQ